MLSGDAARAALAGFTAPEAVRARGVRANGLFAPILASDVAGALTRGDNSWYDAARRLDELRPAKREKVLRALAPQLGGDLARWWEWSVTQPYQRGGARRAYRSSDPAHSLAARWGDLGVLLRHAVQYPQPLAWHADWAMHLGLYPQLGALFASAIAFGDQRIAHVLSASLGGQHRISGPSHTTYVALLAAPDPNGWAQVEELLVTAQRAEGLRQAILEAADLADPDAFARILDLVAEQGLARFASTVRALGVWIGEELGVRQERQVSDAAWRIRNHLRTPPRAADLLTADPTDAFLGLWSLATRDAGAAVAAADVLLGSPVPRTRLAATRILADLRIPQSAPGLTRALADPSLLVQAAALAAWPAHLFSMEASPIPLPEQAHPILRQQMGSLGRVQEVDTGLIGRAPRKVGGTLAADVLIAWSGDRALDRELIDAASADGRWIAAFRYAANPSASRAALFSLLADRSTSVRDTVSRALRTLPSINDQEARILEDALRSTASDLRSTAQTLLLRQDPAALEASIARLAAGTTDQQRAAVELERREHPATTTTTTTTSPQEIPPSIRVGAAERTPARRPLTADPATWQQFHAGVRLTWTSLNAWLAEHADVEVRTSHGVELLANLRWIRAGDDGGLPIAEIIEPWWQRVGPQLTDGGVEVALLNLTHTANPPAWALGLTRTVLGPIAPDLATADQPLAWGVLRAVAAHAYRPSWTEPVIELLEAAAAALPLDRLLGPEEVMARRGIRLERDQWGNIATIDARAQFDALLQGAPSLLGARELNDDQLRRLWHALRFVDEPEGAIDRWSGPQVEVAAPYLFGGASDRIRVPDQPQRWPAPTQVLVAALERGLATRGDLIDALIAEPPVKVNGLHRGPQQEALRLLTGLRPEPWAAGIQVQAVVAEVRAGAILAETTRGDLPSSLTLTAAGLRATFGAEDLVRLLAALGKRPFTRGYAWSKVRESSLSRLIRINQPLAEDTAETLGALVRAAGITDKRLVETAVYAPQWSRLIEAHLGWPGLESAVWWVHAHTNDDSWSVDADVRAQWASMVSQRTPLDAADLVRGAADVAWFGEVITTLGEVRFGTVLKAAKYASSAGGHKRAELFATALMGRLDEHDVVTRIREKRHQDSVRALGLIPATDESSLLRRYELLRSFVASDRTSGSQRRASESVAVEVGLANLARTAGYRDPQRLIWAMEAHAVRDLAQGPIRVSDGDLVVELAIDAAGSPDLSVRRAGKPLKAVPAASAKVPEIAALRERATSLRSQARRMRVSLETACVLGDAFDARELDGLFEHPIIGPMLHALVLIDEDGVVGFGWGTGGLVSSDGRHRPATGRLRVAHPVDLLASGEWSDLQHALVSAQRQQPFKQLFRELYTLNANERDDAGVASRRYAGHQVEARRASGLFTSRGWVADFELGFSRTYHRQKITAWCHLVNGWGSPTEVEDTTIDQITFHPAGQWQPLPLAEVPARVFSETMRDLDLVVSVAHSSGVDPEASESSVAMRGRLVDETAALLDLTNIEVTDHHARVKGTLGTYSVHLGSGVVHRIPGNAVCIVPVSAQHRGRIFLPFADDDPRTAEVVAKVVLLARDDKIKDPTILQQLVG